MNAELAEARSWLVVESAFGNVSARRVLAQLQSKSGLSGESLSWLRDVRAQRPASLQAKFSLELLSNMTVCG